MFQGSFVALVTPFRKEAVDYAALERLIEFQIANRTAGFVPCGTTGESPTLSTEEHKAVIRFVVKRVAGRVPVIAGTGSNSTAEAVDLTRAAAKSGADATLHISPYYNKPEPEGMFRHFREICRASDLPVILYNLPGRTGREIAPETLWRLADEVKQVVGIKESSGSMDRASEILARTGWDLLAGDDSLTLPMMALGASGVVSVAANFMPADIAALVSTALRGDFTTARRMHQRMFPVFRAMFLETNPIPVKEAMEILRLCRAEMRLPLSRMQPQNHERMLAALRDYGLVPSARTRAQRKDRR